METSISNRISILIEVLKMNTSSFSKSLGRSYTAIESIVKGKSKPGYELLESIIKTYPTVNPAWLLTGHGEPLFDKSKEEPAQSDTYLKEHLQTLEANFSRLASQLETKDNQIDRLTRMLENVLGKPKGASFLSQVAILCDN